MPPLLLYSGTSNGYSTSCACTAPSYCRHRPCTTHCDLPLLPTACAPQTPPFARCNRQASPPPLQAPLPSHMLTSSATTSWPRLSLPGPTTDHNEGVTCAWLLYKVLPIKLAAWISWYFALGRVILPVSQNVKGHALHGAEENDINTRSIRRCALGMARARLLRRYALKVSSVACAS